MEKGPQKTKDELEREKKEQLKILESATKTAEALLKRKESLSGDKTTPPKEKDLGNLKSEDLEKGSEKKTKPEKKSVSGWEADNEEIVKKLEETRENYIKEYKKCKKEADKQVLIDKTRDATFNILSRTKNLFSKNKDRIKYRKKEIKPEDYFTEKTNKAKERYNKTRKEMGDTMYQNKKTELEKAGLSGENLEKALAEYKATEIIAKTIFEEKQKIINAKFEKPVLLKRLLDGYRKMPRWQRVALSTALFTVAAGTGIISGGIFAGYGLATLATMKFTASMAMGTFVGHSVKGVDLIKKKSDLEFNKNQSELYEKAKDAFSNNKIGLEEYEEKIRILEREEKKRARDRMFLKAGVGIALAGIAGFVAYDAMGRGIPNMNETDNTLGVIDNKPEVSHIQTEVKVGQPELDNVPPKTTVEQPESANNPSSFNIQHTTPVDRKSTRLNSSHTDISRMPSSA